MFHIYFIIYIKIYRHTHNNKTSTDFIPLPYPKANLFPFPWNTSKGCLKTTSRLLTTKILHSSTFCSATHHWRPLDSYLCFLYPGMD